PTLLHQLTHLGQILPRQDQIQGWIQHMHAAIAHLPRDVQDVISTGLVQANATLKANLTTMVNQVVAVTAGVLLNIFNLLLLFLGVPSLQDILLLALIAAIVAPIPYVGNLLGPLPAVVMALVSSWQGAVAVLVLYVILSNIHDNVLSPKIMSKQLNIDPAILM